MAIEQGDPGDENKIPEDYGNFFDRIDRAQIALDEVSVPTQKIVNPATGVIDAADIALQSAYREKVYRGPHKTGSTGIGPAMMVPDPVTGLGDARPGDLPFGVDMCDDEDTIARNQQLEEIGNDMSAGGGKRLNSGKNRMELVPPEWDVALGDVSTQGSKKYDARNWEKGMEWSVMVGCMKRHLAKFEAGERYDGPEFNIEAGTTGCHHLAMVAWNALALMTYDLREIGKNDLPLGVTTKLLKRVNAITSDLGINQHEPD